MGRILAIDYGKKRTGLAVTDHLKIIASGLCTVESHKLLSYLKEYFSKEQVELVLIGLPVNWDDTPTHGTPLVQQFIKTFEKNFPTVPIRQVDERFTSKNGLTGHVANGTQEKTKAEQGFNR